jgi:hypothetical protein
VIYFSNKMMFSGAPGSQPRPYMIARTGLTEGLSPIQNSENLAKYVIDLDHKEYRDPDTYEVIRSFKHQVL